MIALLMAVVLLWPTSRAPQATAPQTGLLMVRVTDAQTREPVPDAVVTVTGPGGSPPRRQLSDERGRAAFVALPVGSYRVRVQVPGYLEYGDPFDGRVGVAPIVVATGHLYHQVGVRMRRTSTISGRIVDQHGQPLAGILVRAERVYEPRDELQPPWPAQETWTNDLGEYGFAGLLPGAYVTTTRARPAGTLEGQVMVRPSVKSDAQVAVGTGEARSTGDLVVPLTPAVRVSGRVVGATLAKATCSLQLLSAQDVWTRCDADGHFVFDHVTPGTHVIQGTPGNQEETWWIRSVVEVPDLGIDGLVLTRQSGLSVRGSVRRDVSEMTAPPASVEGVRVTAERVRSNDSGLPASSRAATVAADGTFTIDGLVPGRYRFRVTGARGFSLGWIVEAGRRQYAGTRDVDASREGIELILTDRLSRLDGHVDGGVDADVLLFPLHETEWADATGDALRFRRVAAGDDGTFVFADVPAGDYAVVAVSRTAAVLDWMNNASLRLFATTAARVSLHERGTQTIRVAAPRTGR